MASSSVTLSAARKIAGVRGVVWTDGPACTTPERKAWEVELADLLDMVAAVERKARSTKAAAQWLRRLFYSGPLGGAEPASTSSSRPIRVGCRFR